MASMGSLPFLVEANADSTVMMMMLHNRNHKFSSSKFSTLNASSLVRGWGRGRVKHRCSRGLLCLVEKNKHISALGKSSGTSEDKDDSDEVLQATIEKSKKVLALQRELLQQVLCLESVLQRVQGFIFMLSQKGLSFMLRPI